VRQSIARSRSAWRRVALVQSAWGCWARSAGVRPLTRLDRSGALLFVAALVATLPPPAQCAPIR
jgi:hypothetical protein